MRPEQRDRSRIGLRGLVLWLAVGTLLWYRLIGWPPPALPPLPTALPSGTMVDVWLRSPLATDWTGFIAVIGLLGWAFWAWSWASVLLEVGVNLIDAATEQAAWVIGLRRMLRPVCVPFIRRIVDASLGGILLTRVALQPVVADAAVPWQAQVAAVAPSDVQGRALLSPRAVALRASFAFAGGIRVVQNAQSDSGALQVVHEVLYHVQPGDSLWAIAHRFYGDGEKESLLFDANVGRVQLDGGALSRHGVIFPGWTLRVPGPTQGIDIKPGEQWYTVQPGDTLSGICARLLGDPARTAEVFNLNWGAESPDGHKLRDPNLIWPGLRLRMPLDGEGEAQQPPVEATPGSTKASHPAIGAEPDRQDELRGHVPAAPPATASPAPSISAASTPAPVQSAPTPATVETAASGVLGVSTPDAAPALQPGQQVPTTGGQPLSPALAALGAAGLAAAVLAASQLVVYKRKPGRDPDEPESDVSIHNGFAEIDPTEDLARRVAHTADPASAIASLLGQAYAGIFEDLLQPDERRELEGVTVAVTWHGRTSTTLVLAAPVAARPYLIHHMRDAGERAFGEQIDVDGKVDQDGDVVVRVTWDPHHPIAGDLLDRVGASDVPSAWPTPCLVPAFVLYDRQRLAVNWHTLSNVLVAAPTGQGADVPLTALVAALASVRAPEDLGLVVIGRPHSMPDEISVLPHGLLEVADPGKPEAVQQALEGVQLEIDRRRRSGASDDADLVVVIRELCELEPEALVACAAIAAAGPPLGVRMVAASERPVAELLRLCPFIIQFGTRLVLQTASEEDSVAVLGMDGAESLGAGGHALLRLEGRMPYPGWAPYVPADLLARLVHLMGTRARADSLSPAESLAVPPPHEPVDSDESPDTAQTDDEEPAAADVDEAAEPVAESECPRPSATPNWASSRLWELRAAPLRVRCFGACEVRHGDRLLKIGDPELLLLLAVHPVTGIASETVADMLWEEVRADPAGDLRKERSKLRLTLRRLVPDLPADPLPGNAYKGEKVVLLDTSVVSSDVHEFTELLDLAHSLTPPAAIEAYEVALALYRGDLLDAPDMRKYRWMYDADPQIALGRRSELRAMHKEARLKLAALLADGPESGLARAEELYSALCGEDLDNEHLWTALFRIHERTCSSLGLESAVRRFRDAQVELGTTNVTDIDRIPLPPSLERLVQQIRRRIGSSTGDPAAGGD